MCLLFVLFVNKLSVRDVAVVMGDMPWKVTHSRGRSLRPTPGAALGVCRTRA